MSETVSIRTIAATPAALRKSIVDFASGHMSKQEIREVLSHAMMINPACRADIQAFIDHEMQRRQLSSRDHKEIEQLVIRSLSENVPTEASDDRPEQSGLYRVDGEGTMILASDSADARDGDDNKVSKGQPKAALQVGAVLRERFRLDEEVASGSMGLVYRATDLLKLGAGANIHTVAIKVINPEFANDRAALKSFQNEVAHTQLLSHPNIVHLFELDKDGEHYFITMEWLEGESLDALLDRSKGSALPPVQAYAIIEQLCDALIYAHERNVVHADIKPGNVFLTKSGELKLIDFGIAHLEGPANSTATKDSQSVALTPAYASCEALEKQRPNQQDDLFSLACLIYRLLSGRRVFGASTALQAEAQNASPVRIGGMSDGRWAALRKALSFRRADRQAAIKDFAEDFGQRRVPREGKIVPEEDEEEALFTATMTLQSLPEGVAFAVPGLPEEPHVELQQNAVAPVIAGDDDDYDALNDTGKLAALHDQAAALSVAPRAKSVGVNSRVSSQGLSPLEMAAAQATHTELDFDLDFDADAPTDTQNLAPTDTQNLAPTDTQNLAHTDTQNLAHTDTQNLFAEDDSSDAPRHTDTVNLGDMPAPINFFDDDSDDSAFVPLETGTDTVPTKLAAQPAVTATAKPWDDASALATIELKMADLHAAAEPAPLPKPKVAAKTPPNPVPARQQSASAAALPNVPVVKPRSVAPERNDVKPAVLAASHTQRLPDRQPHQSLLDAMLLRIANIPLPIIGGMVAGLAAIAIVVGWVNSPAPPEAAVVNTPAMQLAATQTVAQPSGALPLTASATPRELATQQSFTAAALPEVSSSDASTVINGSATNAAEPTFSQPSALPEIPINTADTGIATGRTIIPVPLGMMPTQPAAPAAAVAVPLAQPRASVAPAAVVPAAQRSTAKFPAQSAPVAAPVQPVAATPSAAAATAVVAAATVLPSTELPAAPPASQPQLQSSAQQDSVAAAPLAPTVTEKLQLLRLQLYAAIAEGRLLAPADNSAINWLEQMRALDANAPTTVAAQQRLATAFVLRAKQSIVDANAEDAIVWTGHAETAGVSTVQVLELRRSIADLLAMSRASIPASAAPPGIKSVPMTKLKFVRYVEPSSPRTSMSGASGWVEVSFVVDVAGATSDIDVTNTSLPERYNELALDAVSKWLFEPYREKGVAIPVSSALRIRFVK